MSVAGVAMDLGGWQCGRPQAGCAGRHSWMGFLAWPWLDEPARQLAVTSLVPATVVYVLWHVGRGTWKDLEMVPVPSRVAAPPPLGQAVLLEDRGIWNGGGPVGRLRAAHITAAFSLISVLLLAPLAQNSGLAQGMLGVHLTIIVVTVASISSSKLAQREEAPLAPSEPARASRRWPDDTVALLAANLYLTTAALAFFFPFDPDRPAAGGLPWLTGAVGMTFWVQWLLLALLLALTAAIRSSTRRRTHAPAVTLPPNAGAPANGCHGRPLPEGWALAGFGTPAAALLAWLLAGGFGGGLVLRGADFLGTPVVTASRAGQHSGLLVVPAPYFWAVAFDFALPVFALIAFSYIQERWLQFRAQEFRRLDAGRGLPDGSVPPPSPLGLRAEEVRYRARLQGFADVWARARLTDETDRVVGALLFFTAAAVAAALAAYAFLGPTWLPEGGIGLIVVAVAAGLVVWPRVQRDVGRLSWLGILRDVGAFWPRVVHPLAAPCHTERIMPDLLERISWLARRDQDAVIICAQGQGSVLAAALVLQLEPYERRHVRLLTYGSPLRRVYARYFPAYFGPAALHRIGELLSQGQPADGEPASRATWPWRNLFRPSDPIGGAIFYDYDISELDNGDVDWQLMDPGIEKKEEGNFLRPQAYREMSYFSDWAFVSTLRYLREWSPVKRA